MFYGRVYLKYLFNVLHLGISRKSGAVKLRLGMHCPTVYNLQIKATAQNH